MHNKIKSLKEIEKVLKNHKKKGETVVQCHGVFDLLHPGHIRHFKEAKKKGDKLVVSITPDKFVNKGPGRPAFNEKLRLESIAALSSVDYVVMNNSKDAINAIKAIKPDFYVKGKEYRNAKKDVTGKIVDEELEVKANGGQIYFTDDIVFSSSSLINQYVENYPANTRKFIENIKKRYSIEDVINKINDLSKLKVLVIGDAIIDEYQYVDLLGQSGKGLHMAAKCLEKDVFLGGSLIIANHIAGFANNVTLLTAVGKSCLHRDFIEKKLDSKVNKQFVFIDNLNTLTKKRYVLKDGKHLIKLFETYSSNESLLNEHKTNQLIDYLKINASNFDLVLVCDFGNGFINSRIIDEISNVKTCLALNTQINSGNRGYNVVTHYKKANFICLNEPELRFASQDRDSSLERISTEILKCMKATSICITKGVKGVYSLSNSKESYNVPIFCSNIIDRVGAGDSYFALASLCFAKGYPLDLASFIGSIASAIDVQIVGNKESIKKVSLCKFLTRLMK